MQFFITYKYLAKLSYFNNHTISLEFLGVRFFPYESRHHFFVENRETG